MAPRFPIEAYLVPAERPALPETMSRLVVPLAGGLPQAIELDRDVSLVILAPSGVAVTWRDADPSALVSSGGEQFDAAVDDSATVAAVDRASPRALVLLRGTPVASVLLVAAARGVTPDDGGEQGAVVELAILDWQLRAGTLRGAGEFGSRLEVAFRRSDRGAERFEPPLVHAEVSRRLQGKQRLESDAGGQNR